MCRLGFLVCGGIMLILISLLWFRISTLSKTFERFSLYFETSVHGLSVGAPVRMNGQTIGQVSSMEIVSVRENPTLKHYVAVSIRVNAKKLRNLVSFPEETDFEEFLPELIDAGLRGQLRMPSLLATGLSLDLYFAPGKPAFTANIPDTPYPEIPTNYKSTSDLVDQVNAVIETKKLRELAEKIRTLKKLLSALNETLDDVDCDTLNAQALAGLSFANSIISNETIRQDISALNREISVMCAILSSQQKLTQEEATRFFKMLRSGQLTLKSISASAKALRDLLNSDTSARQKQILREIRKSTEAILQF